MTVTRKQIAAYLNTQFSNLGAAIGQNSDPVIGFAGDIDLALRKIGKARSELATATVEDGQSESAETLAEYYAALRIWRQLGDRTNLSLGGNSVNFTNQQKVVEDIMNDAKARCASLGYDVSGDGMTIGWLNLDWVEAEPTEA